MDYTNITQIRDLYIKLISNKEDINEANTRSKVVEIFLENLGFKKDWQYFENPIIKGKAIVDITIKRNGKKYMFIEVKKASNTIDRRDLHQLTSYLNSNHIEWGMLTNGKNYILVNNDIKGQYGDKEIIDYNIFDEFDNTAIKYYNFTNIFESRITYYLKYLKQYKVYKLKETDNYTSYTRYNDTISKFFNYLENKYGYIELKYISHDFFIDFNKYDILDSKTNKDRREVTSISTVLNKYAHIRNFYDLYIKNNNGLVNENPFKYFVNSQDLCELYGLKNEFDEDNLTIDDIMFILQNFDNSRNSERNKIVFLLCIYCGAMRQDLVSLKISDVDFDNNTIRFSDKLIKFPPNFIIEIKNYIEHVRNKEFNSDYLFARNYKGYSEKPLSIASINRIVKQGTEILFHNGNRHIKINPEKIKGILAKKLFECGFSIDQIICITGIPITSISDYISNESILERTTIKNLDIMHPFISIFNNVEITEDNDRKIGCMY